MEKANNFKRNIIIAIILLIASIICSVCITYLFLIPAGCLVGIILGMYQRETGEKRKVGIVAAIISTAWGFSFFLIICLRGNSLYYVILLNVVAMIITTCFLVKKKKK